MVLLFRPCLTDAAVARRRCKDAGPELLREVVNTASEITEEKKDVRTLELLFPPLLAPGVNLDLNVSEHFTLFLFNHFLFFF